jgi:hypothetical protein
VEARVPGLRSLKGEPLARETASKTDVMILSWSHERFFSSLVFDTVAGRPLSAWQSGEVVKLG